MPDIEEQEEIRSRAFWSGTITFGLVSIPVNLFPANRAGGVSFRMVDDTGTPLARRYFCPEEEKPIDSDEIVRGHEMDDGDYVVVTDEELEALEPRKSRDIDLRRFVPEDQIDPMYFERGYYLTPGGESTKAYKLLAATMEESGRAGIATFVMRDKEYLIAIMAENGILRAETMRFQDEIRTPGDVGLPEPSRVRTQDVKRIATEIRKLKETAFSTRELKDRHAERVLAVVKKKEKRRQDVYELPEEAEKDEDDGSVIDLMEVLRRSLSGKPASRTAAKRAVTKKRAPAKKRTAAKRPAAKKSTARRRKKA